MYKSRIKVIILAVTIVIALIPWVFLTLRNLGSEDKSIATSVAADEHSAWESASLPPNPESTPEPIPEPTPAPKSTPEPTLEPTPEPPSEVKIIDIKEAYPELSDILDKVSAKFNCAAASLVVYNGDTGEYYIYQYGYADKSARLSVDVDTKFRVASLSKLVTTVCAMVLVDRGLLDLDKDISDYLGYKVRNPNYPDTQITSRMLMQHTSSIFDSDVFQTSRSRDSSRTTQHLLDAGTSYKRRQPGSGFEYTNFGTSVLAAACEMIYGKSFDIFAHEVLFEPLDIDAAYVPIRLDDTENIAVIYNDSHAITRSRQSQLNVVDSSELGHDHHLAQGNLTISTVDFAKILAMLGNDGVMLNVRILLPESVHAINNTNLHTTAYEQGLTTRRSAVPFMPGGYAFWHTGSANGTFAQYIYSADGTNRGIVVTTTGATTGRSSEGMILACTELSKSAWQVVNGA
jgi:CubicO group peptidase (beta-lactamase class C family)